MHLEEAKIIVSEMAEHYTELTAIANKVKVNIDCFIETYLEVIQNA